MICKYCGRPLSSNVCSSCKKTNVLAYTSHALADLVKAPNTSNLSEIQLHDAYEHGFAAGQSHGYANGYDTAQAEAAHNSKRRKQKFVIAAASGAVVLALISSIVTGTIKYHHGYANGVSSGKQEQQLADKALVSGSYQQGHEAGYEEGYKAGYEQGLLVTPAPSPAPTSFVLKVKSKGDAVRQLQQRFIQLGYLAEGEDDGDFGSKTETAVKRFQSDHSLTPTGIVDQALWERIMSKDAVTTAPISPSAVTVTPTVAPPTSVPPDTSFEDGKEKPYSEDEPLNTEQSIQTDIPSISMFSWHLVC